MPPAAHTPARARAHTHTAPPSPAAFAAVCGGGAALAVMLPVETAGKSLAQIHAALYGTAVSGEDSAEAGVRHGGELPSDDEDGAGFDGDEAGKSTGRSAAYTGDAADVRRRGAPVEEDGSP